MKTPLIALAGAGLLLALTACGNASGAPTAPSAQPSVASTTPTAQPSGAGDKPTTQLAGNTFLSTSVTENGKPKELAPNTRIRLQFTDKGWIVAYAGCNTMSTTVSTSGGKLTLEGGLISTLMGCPALFEQENWLREIISAKPTWKLEGNNLYITSGGTTITLVDRKVAEPDYALDGTKWWLESVISGTTAAHLVGSENAWLTVKGDRVTGSTGCNGFDGTVSRGTGTLTFGKFETSHVSHLPCTDVAAKAEAAILNTLKGQVAYSIHSDLLMLRTPAGGLDFTARR